MSREESSFSIGVWPSAAVAVGLALFLGLGTWQWGRYQAKREREQLREERIDEPPVEIDSLSAWREAAIDYRNVEITGEFDAETRIVVEQRTHDGNPGAWLLQPFRFERGDGAILVNRGWIPFEKARESIDPYASGEQGTFVGLGHRVREPVADDSIRSEIEEGEMEVRGATTRWHSFDVPAMYDALGDDVPDGPTVALLGPDHSGDPYPIASYDYVTEPYLTADRHLSYSLFWYTVAIALVGIYLAAGFGALRSERRGRAKDTSR